MVLRGKILHFPGTVGGLRIAHRGGRGLAIVTRAQRV